MRCVLRLMMLVLAITLMSQVQAQEYYKWVDDEGVTHYSSEKPENRDASRVDAHNPPSSSQDEALERLEQQRQQQAQERKAAQQQAEQEEQEKKNPQQVNKKNCKQLRENLKMLNNKPLVRRKNPETGKMEVVKQEQRQKLIKRTKKKLKRCNEMGVGSGESEDS